MTTKTQTPKQLLKKVFHGFASRSKTGMKNTLRFMDYDSDESDDIIEFWEKWNLIEETETKDNHYILAVKRS